MRVLTTSFGLIVVASFLSACGAGHMHHGRKGMGAPLEGIVVVGHGKAQGQPDVARINVGIEVRAGTADQAVQDLNTRMAALVASVKQAGVSDRDVRTSNFSISFEQVPEPPPQPLPATPAPRGPAGKAAPAAPDEPPVKLPAGHYRASNTVEVTMRDLKRASEVLTAATRAGANQIFGIQFELENPNALQGEANAKAVADARARAAKLAQQAGVSLGRVLSISEVIDGGGGPMMHKGGFAAMSRDASANVPVERGELTIQSSVQVVFALDDDRDDD